MYFTILFEHFALSQDAFVCCLGRIWNENLTCEGKSGPELEFEVVLGGYGRREAFILHAKIGLQRRGVFGVGFWRPWPADPIPLEDTVQGSPNQD